MSLTKYFLKSMSFGVEVQSRKQKTLREKKQCWEYDYNKFRFVIIKLSLLTCT